MNKKLLAWLISLVSVLGITFCSKCGAHTKLDHKLGHYVKRSFATCPKCGNIDEWGSGAGGSSGETGGMFAGTDAGSDGGGGF